MTDKHLLLTVNGIPRNMAVGDRTMLLDVLREDLGLTGTKNGCGQGHCGACTVIVDGRAVRSCVTRAARLDGACVETIEGMAAGTSLHPIQEAFVREGAIQCGFCTPGMIMAAKALLDRSPNPQTDEIREALDPNLCRCTGYSAIVRAVRRAAGDDTPDKVDACAAASTRAVGHSIVRPDARDKATGASIYAADLRFDGMLHAAVVRSRHPHARLTLIDGSQALTMPGVVAVLTAADIPGDRVNGHVRRDWPILVDVGDTVRYMGDAVALVAAASPAAARAAADAVRVDYDPLPGVFSAQEALAAGAPQLHASAPANLLRHIPVRKGDIESGFAAAHVVIEGEYSTPCIEHAFLEPEAGVAVPHEDGVTVHVGSQIPFEDRRVVAETLGLSEEKVRIIQTAVGGAFGGKEDVSVQAHVALLARATGRPVKLVLSRQESIIVHPKRHATTIRLRVGADRHGKLTAVEAQIWGDSGAYASLGDHVMTRTASHMAGPYAVPNVQVDCWAAYTNNPPAGAMRGFGVPQAAFAMESAMDELAQRLGLHPLELRRRNALSVGSTTPTGQVLRDSVGLIETIDRVQQAVDALGPGVLEPSGPGKVRGWGFACCYKNVGLGGGAPDTAGAEVALLDERHAQVLVGAAENGQGIVGVAAQIAAEELGIAIENISVVVGDTGRTLDGGATTASRQTFITGNAVRLAARRLKVERDASLGNLAVVRSSHVYTPPATVPLGQTGDKHFAYGYATQAALVEVDQKSGSVQVLRVVAAHDVGKAINPQAVRGQIEGGVVMGIGFALSERLELEDGRTLNADLRRYKVPRARQAPAIDSIIVEAPSSEGPYGAKGVGEITSIPTAPAVTNAIRAATGLRITSLPARLPGAAQT